MAGQRSSAGLAGGDIPPLRTLADPYPTFGGMAVDPENNRLVIGDENRKSVLIYDRLSGSRSGAVTAALRQILGPQTGIGFLGGVEVDPARRELYALNNDIEDRMVVFDYAAQGNAKPKRMLYVPHQAWGVSLNRTRDELAISVQALAAVVFYRREAGGLDAPLRVIRGLSTGLADPHGVFWDAANREIVVANHGNYALITAHSSYDTEVPRVAPLTDAGRFQLPSITVYAETSQGDAKPLRAIQGPRTQLDWPMGVAVDPVHDEIAVANNGDSSVLIFPRRAGGDEAPLRVIRGPRTGIDAPMGVALDTKNDELWVANYGDHTAVVFPRTAAGNAPPKRIIRNAPAGTPTSGFGNPYAVAYDSKRGEVLVPN